MNAKGERKTKARLLENASSLGRHIAHLEAPGTAAQGLQPQDSPRFLQTVIDAIPEVMMVIDRDYRIVLANSAARELAGGEDRVAGHLTCYSMSHHREAPCHGEASPCPLEQVVRTKTPVTVEQTLLDTGGGEVFVEITAAPIFDDAGEVVWVVESFRDITERKGAQEALQKAHDQLEDRVELRTAELAATNNELEAFAYSVSHDLRAPLRGIDGFSAALLEEYGRTLDKQGRDYLARVRAAAGRMAELIDDLLGLSRIGQIEVEYQRVDLSALAEKIAADLRAAGPDRRVTFEIARGLTVDGDSHLLRVMLAKLLDNAWKFTSRHPEARIEFGVAEADNEQAFFVRDDGAGFDMAYVRKLFGPFQRLHSVDEFPGTGIGLAIAQHIVCRHGGRIWAHGETEKGATFYFTLP